MSISAHTVRLAAGALATAALALGALAGCGGSSGSSSSTGAASSAANPPAASSTATQPAAATLTGPDTVTGTAAGVLASMHATTHHPRVNRPWPLRFTVTSAGQPVHASVSYEFLFSGQVVAHRSHFTFDGHLSDIVLWPASAVGYPLTFRAIVTASAASINLDYAVKVTP